MSPIPPMPPTPPPMPPAGAGVSFLGASTTMASLVVKRLLTLAASERAVRTTCKANQCVSARPLTQSRTLPLGVPPLNALSCSSIDRSNSVLTRVNNTGGNTEVCIALHRSLMVHRLTGPVTLLEKHIRGCTLRGSMIPALTRSW